MGELFVVTDHYFLATKGNSAILEMRTLPQEQQ